MPVVSVVIPAYNAEHTVGETLASALSQSFDDIEVIVSDDGSSDATASVVKSVGDKRVRLRSCPNQGVSHARNRGMEEADGEFVAFLDADDVWLPAKLERQVALLRARPDIGLCFTGAVRIGSDSRALAQMPAHEHRDYCEALLLHSMVAGCISSGVVRRELAIEAGGFDPAFSQGADWDFWLRLSRVTDLAPVPEPLVRYRTGVGNMSDDVALLERDTFAVLDKFFADPASAPYRSLRSHAYANHWMICAGSYLHARQPRASLRCLARGLRARPSSARQPLGLPLRRLRRASRTNARPA